MASLQSIDFEMIVIWGLSALGIYYLLMQVTHYARPRFRGKSSSQWSKPRLVASADPAPTRWDSSDQLRDVMAAKFIARPVLSLSEYRVFQVAEDEVKAFGGGFRVLAQTSLGEVIRSDDKRAHSAINSKRVDVLIISRSGLPVAAIEYQGGGHYQSDAAARDAVKKEALRRAGVQYIEVHEHHDEAARRTLVRDALLRASPATSQPSSAGAA